ncbi:MAG: hypothetical protein AAF682_25220 [Planctomycetota bacterium]
MTRRRVAIALIVVGLIGVVWGVLHILEAANGPGTGPTEFAHRRSYNQVKESLHGAFLGGVLRAGIGFSLVLLGGRLQRSEAATTA